MKENELFELLESIAEAGGRKYTTPSGSFLELLRRRAIELNIDGIVNACNIYFEVFPQNKLFIKNRLPAILSNHYFTMRQDLDYEKFIKWSLNNSNGSEQIMENIDSAVSLKACLNAIVDEANKAE